MLGTMLGTVLDSSMTEISGPRNNRSIVVRPGLHRGPSRSSNRSGTCAPAASRNRIGAGLDLAGARATRRSGVAAALAARRAHAAAGTAGNAAATPRTTTAAAAAFRARNAGTIHTASARPAGCIIRARLEAQAHRRLRSAQSRDRHRARIDAAGRATFDTAAAVGGTGSRADATHAAQSVARSVVAAALEPVCLTIDGRRGPAVAAGEPQRGAQEPDACMPTYQHTHLSWPSGLT